MHESKLVPSDDSLGSLVLLLRRLLRDYLDTDTDRFGNGLLQLNDPANGIYHSIITSFAQIILTAANVVGISLVAKLLIDFVNGSALSFQMRTLISGINFDTPMLTPNGIELIRPPYSTTELNQIHPSLSEVIPCTGIAPCLILSVDCQATPVFSRPTFDENTDHATKFNPTLTMTEVLLNRPLSEFCESLSLACNAAVNWIVKWHDLGESKESVAPHVNYEINTWSYRNSINLVQEDWDTALGIHRARFSCEQHRCSLKLALHRWLRSKKAKNNDDKLVELRIAFEALYKLDSQSEKNLRLALTCAWHLGKDFSHRRNIFYTIKEFYRAASAVIHAGQPRSTDNNLVTEIQDICRDGILKSLIESLPPKLEELYLGNDV